jgi:hypothetical protein
VNLFFVVQKSFVILKVSESAQKYNPHIPVYTINYVHALFLGSENHVPRYVLFKLVKLIKIHTGTVKHVFHDSPYFFRVFEVFEEMPCDDNAFYVRSDRHEMAMAVNAKFFLYTARIF